MSTLQLQSLTKSFGSVSVIKGVDLDVTHGQFVVFVGPSGCGKSTLLRMIAGLETASTGVIKIDDAVVNEVSAAQRGCAMVFQSYALYPHMSVYDNMAFGLENAGVAKEQVRKKVTAAAALLRLAELLDRKPTQLSGGQRQRVAIGRAIVRDPKLFLFDEPLSNLDAELRVSMRAELRDLHARLGSTMIYVTHDQVEAMTLADKIVVLRAGKIEQVGTPKELYERPVNTFVAGFIGSPRMNFISNGVGRIGIRPEHIRINAQGAAAGTEGRALTVQQFEYMGASSLLQGVLADGTKVEILLTQPLSVSRGDSVMLSWDAAHEHHFDKNEQRISN
ncbi:MAG: ATP-binding cassette domain-containing protein [Cytophagales bacterium]|nr:ATP-binding cassette domain-containing protein [Cytophagales bacterium]